MISGLNGLMKAASLMINGLISGLNGLIVWVIVPILASAMVMCSATDPMNGPINPRPEWLDDHRIIMHVLVGPRPTVFGLVHDHWAT
jgi:hypothetical protein